MRGGASNSRFDLTSIPRHVHNGIDSPPVFQPVVTYVGNINDNGFPTLLPSGWTSLQTGTGTYKITHNLGPSANYSLVIQPYLNGSGMLANFEIPAAANDNYFNVYTYGVGALGGVFALDDAFFFLLTVVNNRSVQIPSYTLLTPP